MLWNLLKILEDVSVWITVSARSHSADRNWRRSSGSKLCENIIIFSTLFRHYCRDWTIKIRHRFSATGSSSLGFLEFYFRFFFRSWGSCSSRRYHRVLVPSATDGSYSWRSQTESGFWWWKWFTKRVRCVSRKPEKYWADKSMSFRVSDHLKEQLPSLTKALTKLIIHKSAKSRQASLQLLARLVNVLPGCLEPYFDSFLPGVECCLM